MKFQLKFFAKVLTTIGLSMSTLGLSSISQSQDLFRMSDEQTRWISPENPTGAKGSAGKTNQGAKGDAFVVVAPGQTFSLGEIKGSGIIRRIWMSGTIPRNAEQRRLIKLQMFWDGESKPAVDCPIGDFFGVGLGKIASFESALFANPEGRSFVSTVPMPFRKGAKIQIVNEASSFALIWYDINYSEVKKLDSNSLYFHASWRREPKTTIGKDFEILPRITGKGRFLGTNIGVIGNPAYNGTWFGEGEVKVYLDGDTTHPTLQGTGTEDYIGTGWGQGVFKGRASGSLISDDKADQYAFYRYHLDDPIFFHQDCKVTIQQMGNTGIERIREMIAKNIPHKPVWVLDTHGEDVLNIREKAPDIYRLLDLTNLPAITNPNHPRGGINFYRSDDVSATAYFYLNKPSNSLPLLADKKLRMLGVE
jgi:hypothetical protein